MEKTPEVLEAIINMKTTGAKFQWALVFAIANILKAAYVKQYTANALFEVFGKSVVWL